MITSSNERVLCFRGASTDEKPTGCFISNGSIYIEIDTSKKYIYDAENEKWILSKSGGGGGGGVTPQEMEKYVTEQLDQAKESIKEDVKEELKDEIASLKVELTTTIKTDVLNEIESTLVPKIKEEVIEEVKTELVEEISTEVKKEVNDSLSAEFKIVDDTILDHIDTITKKQVDPMDPTKVTYDTSTIDNYVHDVPDVPSPEGSWEDDC